MSAPQIVVLVLGAYTVLGFAFRALILAVGDGSERSARIANVAGIFWPAIVFWFVFSKRGTTS